MSAARKSVLLVCLVAGCMVPRNEDAKPSDNRCTACHGARENGDDQVSQAAPPFDTKGNTDVASPGVGAHVYHLKASGTHAAVACTECHVVPKRAADPGHDDNGGSAEVTFGPLATRDGGPAPTYDFATRTCSNTYCHGAAVKPAVWSAPRPSTDACGSCHALPPPAPHPESTDCALCHDKVINAARLFLDPALHVNGVVDVRALNCASCHGQDDGGAPPRSLDGGLTTEHRGVGAHASHLRGNSFSHDTQCGDCHRVPTAIGSPGHTNGTVEVRLSGIATAGDAGAKYDAAALTCTAWCHAPRGGSSPKWTRASAQLGCDGCHGAPPPAPHPPVTRCVLCHTNLQPDAGFVDKTLHVNGAIEVIALSGCVACHGTGADPAPPKDTRGNTATTAIGVGAHQKHLTTTNARKLLCTECHKVPAQVLSPNHLNDEVEVSITGTGGSFGVAPAYNPTTHTCNSYCHNAGQGFGTSVGGSTPMPVWNLVDGVQASCTGCHAFPPPGAPAGRHPARSDCGTCHQNVVVDGGTVTWLRSDLHVDGLLTFAVP